MALFCCSILLSLALFLKTIFIFLYVSFHSTSISLSPNCIALSPNLNFTATCSIVVVDSLTIALSSFSKVLMYNYHMIALKISMVTTQDYHLLTRIFYV